MLLHRAPSGHGATLSVARRPGGGAYTNGQRALFERLGQHVRDATRIMISLLVKDEMLRTVTWALDHWPSAAFLLSASGHVVQSNHAARRMVERADGLEIIAGRLVARHEHEQAILARLLAEAVASGQALDPAAHLAVTGTLPPRRLELTLQAIPSGEMLRGWNQSPPAVIVLVSDPTDRALRRSQLLSTTYRLTPTESKLVAMIAVGHNVSQLAQQLGLSKETIRSHLKRIFAKAGVNRQSQLIYLLASDAPLPARRSRTPDERGFEALSCRMA